jgi:hypothetical protein
LVERRGGRIDSARSRHTPSIINQLIDHPTTRTNSRQLSQQHNPERVRNVCVIAHIDHGKTTLTDKLMDAGRNAGTRVERQMDSMSLEKERGISIMSKVGAGSISLLSVVVVVVVFLF